MNAEACRLATAIGRLTTSFQSGMLTLERARSGGRQHVVVQYVHQHVEVGEGGQAMVAGQVKAGDGRKQDGGGAAKMDNERHAAWREGLDRADASPHCRARRRDGAECQALALPNGRCRMHVNGLAFRRSFSSGTAIPVWHFGRPEPKMTSA